MRRESYIVGGMGCVTVLLILAQLTIAAVIVYASWHFIHKFW
jgi:hypothetical protein